MRRLLSTKVSRPLQNAKKVEKAKVVHESEDIHNITILRGSESSETNPWSHFAAFSSMEDYVDVTLIQYNKEDKEGGKKE